MSNCGPCKYLNAVLKLRVEKYVLQLVRKVMLTLQSCRLENASCLLVIERESAPKSQRRVALVVRMDSITIDSAKQSFKSLWLHNYETVLS